MQHVSRAHKGLQWLATLFLHKAVQILSPSHTIGACQLLRVGFDQRKVEPHGLKVLPAPSAQLINALMYGIASQP